MGIGIIMRSAFAGDVDMGEFADTLALRRSGDGAGVPCFCPLGVPAKVKTLCLDRS
jgi:hypothetical protein